MTNAFTAAIEQAASHINMNRPSGDHSDDNQASPDNLLTAVDVAVQLPASLSDTTPHPADKPGSTEQTSSELRRVRDEVANKLRHLADQIEQETGYKLAGLDKVTAVKPGPKASYDLWKPAISLFVNNPATLDMPIKELVALLDQGQPSFTVKTYMLYNKLNDYAFKNAKRHLQKLGVSITLNKPATVISIRNQFVERRERLAGLETFLGKFEIRGGKTAVVNGKEYDIQVNGSVRRIRFKDSGWLNLNALKAFCKRSD